MSFKARKAQKRVSIYSSVIAPDGYGGNTLTVVLVATRWCMIEDVGSNSYQSEAGITDFTNTQKFTFRYDTNLILNPKTHILKYSNKEYSILDVKTRGFSHVEQIVVGKQILGLD